MVKRCSVERELWSKAWITAILCVLAAVSTTEKAFCRQQADKPLRVKKMPSAREELNLKDIPYKILFETYCRTEGKENWELYRMNADDSERANLTNTPDLNEMYPHASPDGTKISFVIDEEIGMSMLRNVYYMNIDGTQRVKVARNAREPCWSPDGKSIAYLKGEYERYTTREYATSELFIYDLETGEHRPHPNNELHHIYAICWSPDGKWFLAAIHGGMGYSDTILAIEANGSGVFDMLQWGVKGCRPDISRNGKKLVWGETDWELCFADIDFTPPVPRVDNIQKVVKCLTAAKIYHVDISPDNKYIVFSFGPFEGGQQVGGKARGWDICVSDLSGKWVKITNDGNHNKEPDWVPIPAVNEKAAKESP